MKKWIRRFALALLAVFAVVSIFPYLIPIEISDRDSAVKVFPNSQYIEIDGITIHYRTWDEKTEYPMGKALLVHGLGGSTYSWEGTAEALSQAGYFVAAVDLPAFGYSSRALGIDHSQKTMSLVLFQLMESIDENFSEEADTKKWSLIGHSMGGGTVAAMGIQNSSRIEKLVFVDGALFDREESVFDWALHYPPAQRWLKVALQYWLISEDNIRSALETANGATVSDEQVKGYLSPLQVKGTANTLVDFLKTSKNEPVESLMQITAPSYAIWGSQDTWVPVSQADRIKEYLPEMELVLVEGAGHLPMETHTERFMEILLRILGEPIE